MSRVNKYLVEQSGMDQTLRLLINLRVSQINECFSCAAFYWMELRTLGEALPRIHLLSAWRKAPCYSARERAALEWAEAVTLRPDGEGSDRVYHAVRAEFTDEELANLTLAVAAINSWNMLAMAFPREVGRRSSFDLAEHSGDLLYIADVRLNQETVRAAPSDSGDR
jgi:AhpD family alkylhydroperoxidase